MIGIGEIIVIMVVAGVIIRPDELPSLLRDIRNIKRAWDASILHIKNEYSKVSGVYLDDHLHNHGDAGEVYYVKDITKTR